MRLVRKNWTDWSVFSSDFQYLEADQMAEVNWVLVVVHPHPQRLFFVESIERKRLVFEWKAIINLTSSGLSSVLCSGCFDGRRVLYWLRVSQWIVSFALLCAAVLCDSSINEAKKWQRNRFSFKRNKKWISTCFVLPAASSPSPASPSSLPAAPTLSALAAFGAADSTAVGSFSIGSLGISGLF